MAILSQIAIKKLLESRDLIIDPLPTNEDFDSDAVEVHLGNRVYVWEKQSSGSVLTVSLWKRLGASESGAFDYREFAARNLKVVPADSDGIITMRPHTFYLADLKQFTKLPHDVAMQIQGKSSLARLGVLVHLTAPHAHAGWEGTLTLEIYNLGPFNIELKPGIPIGQLSFWRVDNPTQDIPRGQFSGQADAAGRQ
jgi:dCTP deaminase